MFSHHFGKLVFPGYWLENAVFGLDRWLRRRQGIFGDIDAPACIFRVRRARAEKPLTLSGEARIEPGMPILKLHLWDERVPLRGSEGTTVGWAYISTAPPSHRCGNWRSGSLHHFGENLLIFLLVLATNPVAFGTAALRRDHNLVYLWRAALERRYGGAWTDCNDVRGPRAC